MLGWWQFFIIAISFSERMCMIKTAKVKTHVPDSKLRSCEDGKQNCDEYPRKKYKNSNKTPKLPHNKTRQSYTDRKYFLLPTYHVSFILKLRFVDDFHCELRLGVAQAAFSYNGKVAVSYHLADLIPAFNHVAARYMTRWGLQKKKC